MSLHVGTGFNIALMGSAARVAQARAASQRSAIEGIDGSSAAPARDESDRYDPTGRFVEPGARPRHAQFQDQVVSFGGVLVSREVGAAIMQAQNLKNANATLAADAEKQIANYEFVQSLMGPAQVMPVVQPFQ